MNLAKSRDFFDPEHVANQDIHIIGCGAIGSNLAENIARLGVSKIHLWDFDIVEEHNLTNQLFTYKHLGEPKTKALAQMLQEINPEMHVHTHDNGWNGEELKDFIFMGVDSINTRKNIVNTHRVYAGNIKAIFDFRMRLTDAQHYAATNSTEDLKRMLKTMDFTDEEAKEATPVSACNTTLSITPTVRTITSYGIANFINFVLNGKLKRMIQLDPFNYLHDVFN